MSEIVRKIHADLLAKIQAEPEKKFQILLRFPKEWYEKVGQYTSKEFLFNSIKAIFSFWDRWFGNIVFLDFVRAESLDLYYVVLEIKGRLIPALEKFPDVEWISEQLGYHAIDLSEEGIPGSHATIFPLIHETVPYLGFDKIHKDQKFVDKGLGRDGSPFGIADTGVSTGTGEKWIWLYENPEGLSQGKQGKYRVLEAKDCTYPPLTPKDGVGHGSHIANQVASAGKKYYGAVPQGRLYVAKVLNDQGAGLTTWIIKGIDWLVGKGCKVINLSLGSDQNTDGTDELSVACDKAWDLGVFMVIAIGNNGGKTRPYCDATIGTPACCKKCVVVGATSGVKSQPEQTQYWSSRPPTKDGRKFELKYVVAPGLKIAGYDSRMNEKSGSSFAAPWVAALAWILRLMHSEWSNDQIWEAIYKTVVPLGYKDAYGKEEGFCLEGYGRIDAWAAYNYKAEPQPPPPIPEKRVKLSMIITVDGKEKLVDAFFGKRIEVQQEIVSED